MDNRPRKRPRRGGPPRISTGNRYLLGLLPRLNRTGSITVSPDVAAQIVAAVPRAAGRIMDSTTGALFGVPRAVTPRPVATGDPPSTPNWGNDDGGFFGSSPAPQRHRAAPRKPTGKPVSKPVRKPVVKSARKPTGKPMDILTGNPQRKPTVPARSSSPEESDSDGESCETITRIRGYSSVFDFENDPNTRLRVDLTIQRDLRFHTRLRYLAYVYLVNSTFQDNHLQVGYILAYRVAKKSRLYPNVTSDWVDEWLRRSLDDDDENRIHGHGIPMAWSLQAVFEQDGQPKERVVAPFRDQLGDNGNELLYISELQIFTSDEDTGLRLGGRNFAQTAMMTLFRLLFLGPPWVAFSGTITVILQPGELVNDDSRAYWDRQAPADETRLGRLDRVSQTLRRFYEEKLGFTLLISDSSVMESLITLVARTVEPAVMTPGDMVVNVSDLSQTRDR